MRRFGQVIIRKFMRQRPGDFAYIIAGAGFAFQPMRGKINDGVVIKRAAIIILIDGIENIGKRHPTHFNARFFAQFAPRSFFCPFADMLRAAG